MSIWFNKAISIDDIKHLGKDTMADFLGLEWVEIGDDVLKIMGDWLVIKLKAKTR